MDALHDALISIRRILRAPEIHDKALRAATNLKTSQLMVLQTLEDDEDMTFGAITGQVRMAQASVTAIVVKLEQMGLVIRERGTTDKRKVYVCLTDLGHNVLDEAPEALHRRFAEQFEPLQAWEQTMIVSALQRVATMMNAPTLDSPPVFEFEHLGHPDQGEEP
ncbi:MAG: MarR family transcriptional regulator [Rhodospirillales bacterium]|nr:MarR family transcriptional regulator [Rhodospirillales bacterium]